MSDIEWRKVSLEPRGTLPTNAPNWMHALPTGGTLPTLLQMIEKDRWPELPADPADFRLMGQGRQHMCWFLICTHTTREDRTARFVTKASMRGIRRDRGTFAHSKWMLQAHYAWELGPVRTAQMGREVQALKHGPRSPEAMREDVETILGRWSGYLRKGMTAPPCQMPER